MDSKLLLLTVVLITIAAGVFYYINLAYSNKQNGKSKPRQRSGRQEIDFDAEHRHDTALHYYLPIKKELWH